MQQILFIQETTTWGKSLSLANIFPRLNCPTVGHCCIPHICIISFHHCSIPMLFHRDLCAYIHFGLRILLKKEWAALIPNREECLIFFQDTNQHICYLKFPTDKKLKASQPDRITKLRYKPVDDGPNHAVAERTGRWWTPVRPLCIPQVKKKIGRSKNGLLPASKLIPTHSNDSTPFVVHCWIWQLVVGVFS